MKRLSQTVLLTIILTAHQVFALGPIDLRPYFPDVTNTYRLSNGTAQVKCDFYFSHDDGDDDDNDGDQNTCFWRLYQSHFNLQKPGDLLIWEKIFASDPTNAPEALNCTATYAHLYLGKNNDRSVIEVGEWLNSNGMPRASDGTCKDRFLPLGFQHSTTFSLPATGLNWSGPNGLDTTYSSFQSSFVFGNQETYIYANRQAYSTPGLVEVLPHWSPAWGRKDGEWTTNHDNVYDDVVRMVFYHGVKGEGPDIECQGLDADNPYSSYYLHVPGYRTYALELFLDTQHGIVQETVLFSESEFFGTPCEEAFPALVPMESLSAGLGRWQWYLDRSKRSSTTDINCVE